MAPPATSRPTPLSVGMWDKIPALVVVHTLVYHYTYSDACTGGRTDNRSPTRHVLSTPRAPASRRTTSQGTINEGYTKMVAGLVGEEPPFKTPAPECTLQKLKVHSVAVVLVDGYHPAPFPSAPSGLGAAQYLVMWRVGVWRTVRAKRTPVHGSCTEAFHVSVKEEEWECLYKG